MLQSQTTPVDLSGKNLSYNAIHSSNDQKKVIPAAHAPASTYAIIKTMPKFLPAVEEALSNNSYNRSSSRESIKNYDTYFIAEKNAYYRGEWLNKLPHGLGTVVYGNGSYYEGSFDQGNANDTNGFLVLPNGGVYTGSIKDSIIRGKGTLKVGSRQGMYEYNGQWFDGKPHGVGEEIYPDGSSYRGEFFHGVKESKNPSTYYNKPLGMTYNGGFKNGLFEGENCSYASATSRYVGKFVQGKKEGMGKFSNEVGTQSGNFHNDELNGLGTFEWKDGKLYEGEFQRSKFHGKGKITYKNKQVAEGIWEDGHNKILNSVAVKK